MKAWCDRREKKRADAYALESYRLQMQDALRWLAEFPDVCLLIETMQTFAGDKNVTAYDSMGLRAVMRTIREAKFQDALNRRVLVNTRKTLEEVITHGGFLVASGSNDRRLVSLFFGVLADQVEHMIANGSLRGRSSLPKVREAIKFARTPVSLGLWTGESAFEAFTVLTKEVEHAIQQAANTA